MIADPRLPADCRHMLLVKVGEALKSSPLVVALIGSARAERVTRDACAKACVTLIDGTRMEEHAALVEHLQAARRPDARPSSSAPSRMARSTSSARCWSR